MQWSALELQQINPIPTFKPGQQVWIIVERAVDEVRVLSALFELCVSDEKKGEFSFVHSGYKLSRYRFLEEGNAPSMEYHTFEIYASRELAEQDVVWHSVSGLSEEEWFAAIGDPEERESLDTCELSHCCAHTATIRDLLTACQDDDGLLERDRKRLKALVEGGENGHEHFSPGKHPLLDRIFTQLDIHLPKGG